MHGAASLSDADLIAVLLGTGSPGEPVLVAAARLLSAAGGLTSLHRLGIAALSAQPGIGFTKACRVRAAVELGRRLQGTPLWRGRRIQCSRDVHEAMAPRLAQASQERFVALALDARHRPLAEIDIACGGLTSCSVSPSDVFRAVLREAAAAVVFVHNHPSGEPTPSDDDVAITARLRRAGTLLGIDVIDHVIIAADGYFSFVDAGLMDDSRW